MSCPPLCPPKKSRFSWLFVALSGRLAPTEGRPLSEPAIPDSPQAAGPAVPERDIGAGGVPGCSGMPGSWKSQPARQRSRIPESGHRPTPWQLRCRHGEGPPMGAGKPGLERPRNDRRFPPRGVKAVGSQRWAIRKGGGAHLDGPLLGHPQRDSLRGGSPRRCGLGLPRNPASDAGRHGFPASAAEKRSEAAPRVSSSRPAQRRAVREGCWW